MAWERQGRGLVNRNVYLWKWEALANLAESSPDVLRRTSIDHSDEEFWHGEVKENERQLNHHRIFPGRLLHSLELK